MKNDYLKNIPSIQKISEQKRFEEFTKLFSRKIVINELRILLDQYRDAKNSALNITMEMIFENLQTNLNDLTDDHPKQIINVSGVILQTNFGRAPLSKQAIKAMSNIGSNYSNLEYDLDENKRGGRLKKFKKIINRLTKAENALVINNNAAAVFLALRAICNNKEVLVSRSESVEIGGGFRIPDVLIESNAILIDVGTTNKTYVEDYESKISENTGCILLVHQSNFKIEGFTYKPNIKEIVDMAKKKSVPVFYDLGSGCLIDTKEYGLEYEPTVQDAIRDGVDLVFFSGDKLIGGPQAGIIAGKNEYVEIIEKHPLTRALRLDKVLLSGLHATLQLYLNDQYHDIPLWNILSKSNIYIYDLVNDWKNKLNHESRKILLRQPTNDIFSVEKSMTMIGGGSIPEQSIKSYSLIINCDMLNITAGQLNLNFKSYPTPMLSRIKYNKLFIDPITILNDQEELVIKIIKQEMKKLGVIY
tara:strand:- start:937 stop:2358 length:1422 start_codon:yes stop_codon:yes gene_type:complete